MPRLPRYLPRPGCLVEITQRTLQGRYLLRPSRRLNQLLIGILAKAQQETELAVQAIAVLSNHFHLLASPATVEQIARFMGHLKTNIAKEIGRLHDWPGSMFDRRYTMIPVSDEEEAQIKRLEYILSQGCKKSLVMSPLEWPGAHCAGALLTGYPLRGIWIDRTRQWAASQREADTEESDFETDVELKLDTLPCWKHLAPEARQQHILELIEKIERDTARLHQDRGTEPLGAFLVGQQQTHRRPGQQPTNPPPFFHVYRKKVRHAMRLALGEFLTAYRTAAEKLRSRGAPSGFPENSFPPRPKFVDTNTPSDSS